MINLNAQDCPSSSEDVKRSPFRNTGSTAVLVRLRLSSNEAVGESVPTAALSRLGAVPFTDDLGVKSSSVAVSTFSSSSLLLRSVEFP